MLTPDLIQQIYDYQTLSFYLILLSSFFAYSSTKDKMRKGTSPTFFTADSKYAFKFFFNFLKLWAFYSLVIVLFFFLLFSIQVGYKALTEFL